MLGLDFKSSLNANETSWVGYRDLPPQSRSLLVCEWYLALSRVSSLLVNAVPLELTLSDRWGLRLVAGLGAQQFPDKTAELPRDSHHRLVALESPRQQTRVTTMQPVLRSPTDGPHLMPVDLPGAGSVPCSLWVASRNAGRTPPVTSAREHCRIW